MPALTPPLSPPQLDAFFDLTGSRVPLGSGRSSPFVNTGSYADALQNQGIFGTMGESWRGGLAGGHRPPMVAVPSPTQPPLLHPPRENQRRGNPAHGAEDHGAVHVHPEEPQVRGGLVRDPSRLGEAGGRGAGGARGLILRSPQRLTAPMGLRTRPGVAAHCTDGKPQPGASSWHRNHRPPPPQGGHQHGRGPRPPSLSPSTSPHTCHPHAHVPACLATGL